MNAMRECMRACGKEESWMELKRLSHRFVRCDSLASSSPPLTVRFIFFGVVRRATHQHSLYVHPSTHQSRAEASIADSLIGQFELLRNKRILDNFRALVWFGHSHKHHWSYLSQQICATLCIVIASTMFSDRDPNSFTNLRENEIVVPGGHLDNSSSVIYDVRFEHHRHVWNLTLPSFPFVGRFIWWRTKHSQNWPAATAPTCSRDDSPASPAPCPSHQHYRRNPSLLSSWHCHNEIGHPRSAFWIGQRTCLAAIRRHSS